MLQKILLIEDEPDIRKTLEYNLSREGFDVVCAYLCTPESHHTFRCNYLHLLDPLFIPCLHLPSEGDGGFGVPVGLTGYDHHGYLGGHFFEVQGRGVLHVHLADRLAHGDAVLLHPLRRVPEEKAVRHEERLTRTEQSFRTIDLQPGASSDCVQA